MKQEVQQDPQSQLTTMVNLVEDIQSILIPVSEGSHAKGFPKSSNLTVRLRKKIEELYNGKFKLIFVGEFNSGKSSLINSLLEKDLLTTGAIPTTSVITRIKNGDNTQVKIFYKSGEQNFVGFEDYKNHCNILMATEHPSTSTLDNQEDFSKIDYIELVTPFSLGASGLELIDTPGLGENEHRTDLVLNYFPEAHGVVVILDALKPLSRNEREFISLLGQPPFESVFFVTSRIDLVNENDRKTVFEYIKKQLMPYFKGKLDENNSDLFTSRVFFVSPIWADEAMKAESQNSKKLESSGIPKLKTAINKLLNYDERVSIGQNSILLDLIDLQENLKKNIEYWNTVMRHPLDELEKRQKETEDKIVQMQSNAIYISDRFSNFGKNVQHEIYSSLIDYIDEMRGTWKHDIESFDLSELYDLNIFAKNLNEKEKERVSSILEKEVLKYLDSKLIRWAQKVPIHIQSSVASLILDIRQEIAIFDLDLEDILQKLSGSNSTVDTSNNGNGLSLNDGLVSDLLKKYISTNTLVDRIVKPIMNDLKNQFQDSNFLRTIGYNTILALLGVGAAILSGSWVVAFVVTLGAGIINTLKRRSEDISYRKIMNEEVSSERVLSGFSSEEVQSVKKLVRDAFNEKFSSQFFEKLNKLVQNYKNEMSDRIESAFDNIGKEIASHLTNSIELVQQTQTALVKHKQNNSIIFLEIKSDIDTKFEYFIELFDNYCKVVVGRVFTGNEIQNLIADRKIFATFHKNEFWENNYSQQSDEIAALLISKNKLYENKKIGHSNINEIKSLQTIIERSLVNNVSGNLNSAKIKTPLAALNDLTGLKSVKNKIQELTNYQREMIDRRNAGYPDNNPPSLHLVFTGNPGTGKTTVAKIIGELYYDIGLLKKGHTVIVGRNELIGKYIGHTSPQVVKVIESALDGVLFIDEAYNLTTKENSNDFSEEVITLLLEAMVNYKGRLAVIVAGYSDKMQGFLNSNQGLRHRFSEENIIHFPNYDYEDLLTICLTEIEEKKYAISSNGLEGIKEVIKGLSISSMYDLNFSNARTIQGFTESLFIQRANRRQRNALERHEPIEAEDISETYAKYRDIARNVSENELFTKKEERFEHIQERKSVVNVNAEWTNSSIKASKEQQIHQIARHTGRGDNIAGDKIINNNYNHGENLIIPKYITGVVSKTEFFCGREKSLLDLDNLFLNNRCIVLFGVPGIGKTSTAIQYLYSNKIGFDHYIWLSCSTTIHDSFRDDRVLLENIRYSYDDKDDKDTRSKLIINKIVSTVKERSTLIILDNIEQKHQYELLNLELPDNFKILAITSEVFEGFSKHELEPLDFDNAKKIFQYHIKKNENKIADIDLNKIFDEVGYHTQTIEILSKILASRKDVLLSGKDIDVYLKQKGGNNSVINQVSNLFNLSELSDDENFVLRSLSVLPSMFLHFDELLFLLNISDTKLSDSLNLLISKGFVQENEKREFKCHQVILNVSRHLLQPTVENCQHLIQSLGKKLFIHYDLFSNKKLIEMAPRLFLLVNNMASYLEDKSSEFAYIYQNLGVLAKMLGEFDLALKFHKLNVEICLQNKVYRSEQFTRALHYISDTYYTVGNYKKVEELRKEEIDLLMKSEVKQDREIARAYEGLGMAYHRMGSLAEASENYSEALNILQPLPNVDKIDIAQIKINLGTVLIGLGELTEGRTLIENTIEVLNLNDKECLLHLGSAYINLSNSYLVTSEFIKVDEYRKKAFDIYKMILPESDYVFASIYCNEAQSIVGKISQYGITTTEEKDKYKEQLRSSQEIQLKAIELLRKHREKEHLDFTIHYFNLTNIYYLQENLGLASDCFNYCLKMSSTENDANLNLSIFYFFGTIAFPNLFKLDTVIENFKKSIYYLPKRDEYNLNLALYHLFFGGFYSENGDTKNALHEFIESYRLYKVIFKEDHPIHAFCLQCMALTYKDLGQMQNALSLQLQVVQLCEANMDNDDAGLVEPYINLSLIYAENGNQEKAFLFKQKATLLDDGNNDFSKIENVGKHKI
jgi:stage V sporulation protein K